MTQLSSLCVYCGEKLVKYTNGVMDAHQCVPVYKCTICEKPLTTASEISYKVHHLCVKKEYKECSVCKESLELGLEIYYGVHQKCLKCVECGETVKDGNLPCITTMDQHNYHYECMCCNICGKYGICDKEKVCPLLLVHHSCINCK